MATNLESPPLPSPEAEGPAYSAPALDKGLDILELLCRNETPLSQKEIAQQLKRTVGELYRMVACLLERGYLTTVGDKYYVTTKLYELAHANPPTHRLLVEAAPIMQKLASDVDQSCFLTLYDQGRQIVLAKVEAPSGMGFSLRVGAELDVLVSTTGRIHIAFQETETRQLRIEESLRRRPDHKIPDIDAILDLIKARGYESRPSEQVRGLHAISYPILDTKGHAIAALTVPYAERIDQTHRISVSTVEKILGDAARLLSARMGGAKHR